MIAKPFIKWVGGKGKLIPELRDFYPKSYNRYYEPFVGGGALFFDIIQNGNVKFSSINDINKKLIITYQQIQKNVNYLIVVLKKIELEYKKLSKERQKEFFYEVRKKYNKQNLDEVTTAAYLIFLNKTCFNGMYRENSKGEYNIPFGDQKNPNICDEENLSAVSTSLKNTKITNLSFEKSIENCEKGDFIYFDPPYYPINVTSSFTGYHRNTFGPNEQIKLKDVFVSLAKKKCFVMLSNSNTDFIKELYKKYNFNFVYAARSINSKGNGRGKIVELVVTNY